MTMRRFGFASLLALSLATTACDGKTAVEGGEDPSTTGTTGPANNGGTTDVELPPFEAPAPKMRRLSKVEYQNTVRDLFGDFIEVPELEPDTPVNGFSAIGNAQIATSRLGVERYETAAFAVAEQVLRNPARVNLIDCAPQFAVDSACAQSFIERNGPRVFRRPLTDIEVQRYTRVAATAMRDLDDFWLGLEFGLAAMLQSPHFLYRTEWGDTEEGDRRRLNGYEVASRLSYFVWASAPDAMLLQAAAEGRLDTEEGIRDELDRMLRNPRSVRGLRTLWDEYLALEPLCHKIKEPNLYPEFDENLAADMREETLRLIESYMTADADFREIFSTPKTFVNADLADLYELDVQVSGDDWVEVQHDNPKRRGILGHASFLTANSHAATTSPTHRGLFVRQALLCLPIPPPPPNIDLTIEPAQPGETLRDKLSVHMESDGCSGCHTLMDPIGFAYESFDAIGRYRTQDNGVDVDTTGELDGESFEHAGDLAGIVASHPSLSSCMVRKLYRHAVGHVEGPTEEILMRQRDKEWGTNGYRFRELLEAIVTSEGFLYVKGGE